MELDIPECETKKDTATTVKAYENYIKTGKYQKLNCSCPQPCFQMVYRLQIMPSLERLENTWVLIYFPSKKMEVLIEREAYDISQMVGEVGGCVGMFLGVSLISIYEFLDHYIRMWMS